MCLYVFTQWTVKGVCFLLTQRRFLSRSSLLRVRTNDLLCGSRKSGTSGIRLRMWQWAHLLRDGLNNNLIKSFGSGSLTSQLISQMSQTRNLSHLQMMSPWINVFWSALWMSPLTLCTSAWRDATLSAPQHNSDGDGHVLQASDRRPFTRANNIRVKPMLDWRKGGNASFYNQKSEGEMHDMFSVEIFILHCVQLWKFRSYLTDGALLWYIDNLVLSWY